MMKKSELARRYFPNAKTDNSACTMLAQYMRRCTSLMTELREVGYYPTQRMLTPRQVALITHYLGEP